MQSSCSSKNRFRSVFSELETAQLEERVKVMELEELQQQMEDQQVEYELQRIQTQAKDAQQVQEGSH